MPKKKKIGSYPNAMIVMSLTAALFLIGFCGLLVIQSKKLVSIIRENIEVRVFLNKEETQAGQDSILKVIQAKPFVLASSEVKPITFVSKEEAAKEFIEGTKEDFVTFLGENPLRDSYRVKIQEDYFEEAKLQAIKKELEKIKGVYEVVYQEDLADNINRNVTKIYVVLASFALIMLIIIVLLVNNTIRLAIYSQRFLIRSMQLVGATNGFIQRPYVMRGAIQGLIGGVLAGALLVGLQQLAVRNVEGLGMLQEYDKIIILVGTVLILGILIGIASTYQSLTRYLRMALDDLY
ncbi:MULTISPECIES: ABC transporter permease [Dyadobacter]|jgi:cell division transport system permease protein|uniref:Cell division protein FtsX n=1 Tax=Dyadobacter chenhuakuii TaxID=2909339 RepID=A0A9X1TSV6_9BACT|nr:MULTISPECIES: permease-like cell division protein FtsX [Dyadobacter]MCE7072653.1 ABC transporter permease [Dyadobacter sp. CY327]MCF2493404.1 ABC transporter permease [Dyadobacter chenhuakuii]MCF2497708.1 ABC transporter permease [Dyadobacter chenhuakuii]MCF2517213.1 ABC transporter permease [Dyadobacter sp. CY351]USJ32319.1 ABC transporter permease [Dyadobacter chenhuakuii]